MLRHVSIIAAVTFCFVATAEAKYPVLSRFARTADGPYQPQVRRYVVVDPVPPVGVLPGYDMSHGNIAAHDSQMWRRHDLATPVYPYGWFGARNADERQTRGSYYDDYVNTSILRGR